ncbi:Astacin (Peptidase M12A) [Parelaphostrongylus tenuis]|uniref:Astacin (Peptidase M12A) n=1 Tax=Parelaphostrongylus tenuis TaxID=148309 RepID=A0AAD5QNL3_PARTN|nr:Astacin (Peptidase M12A) [Parelaphostrongylus tenuis]
MVPRDMDYMQTLGSRTQLSFYEKLMMNFHYKCLAKGCGKILEATSSYQTLEDRVGEEGARRASDELMTCNYWIQLHRSLESLATLISNRTIFEGPPGSKIEVLLDRYPKGISSQGCDFAGFEVKTGSDKSHTGYRWESKDKRQSYVI